MQDNLRDGGTAARAMSVNPQLSIAGNGDKENLMVMRRILTLAALVVVSAGGYISASAQGTQPQIPTLQVCNKTRADGRGIVKIDSRADAIHSGKFAISIQLKCDADNVYPTGSLLISDINMSDSIVQGTITATSFEQVTTTGKHTPTVFLNGRCTAANVRGCRFWLMIADNKRGDGAGTPDVVSFLVFDGNGQRIAYGTGPVLSGDLTVGATAN